MAYRTGDSFMDHWINRQMGCDKSRLNCGVRVPHLSLQASGPWSKSSIEIFYIDQSFSIKERHSSMSFLMQGHGLKGMGSVKYDEETST